MTPLKSYFNSRAKATCIDDENCVLLCDAVVLAVMEGGYEDGKRA